jgi:hypothetical protein
MSADVVDKIAQVFIAISWKGQGKGMGFKTGERYTRASTTNRAI